MCNPSPGAVNVEARVVAGDPVGSVLYHFYSGKLYEIDLRFAAVRYRVIKAAFQDKYGSPTERSESQFQNGFGAKWAGESLLWKVGTESLFLYEGPKNGPGQDGFDEIAFSMATFTDSALAPSPSPAKKPDF